MRNIFRLVTVLAVPVALLLSSCAMELTYTYRPFAATNNPIEEKVGMAERREGGVLAAAQNGGITRIATVDIRTGSDGTVTYIVTGD
ncbi:hypothetical protein FACS1894200_09740 [Spirochaetia bacterium]|nr:hypothetical protein FACS1894200_09740 [Spirochaetia bacterium]